VIRQVEETGGEGMETFIPGKVAQKGNITGTPPLRRKGLKGGSFKKKVEPQLGEGMRSAGMSLL